MRTQVRSLDFAQWVKDLAFVVSYSIGHRCALDPELLWLWCQPATTAPIWSLTWEPPYATGAPPPKKKERKKRREVAFNDSVLSLLPQFLHLRKPELFCSQGASPPQTRKTLTPEFTFPPLYPYTRIQLLQVCSDFSFYGPGSFIFLQKDGGGG